MADSRPTRPHQGLPEEIVIWEILVRLPPNTLLRCRAVCRAWRRATSTRDFLLAHHGRQPALPLSSDLRNIITFDNRAAEAKVQQVAGVRLDYTIHLDASCDGLLLFTDRSMGACVSICNPATREHAPLPMLSAFIPLGMYQHSHTGEYRILLIQDYDDPATDACYIFALGSVQPPRNIGWLPETEHQVTFCGEAILLHGSLHWYLEKLESTSNIVMVFDTTTELFRNMCTPVVSDRANLFEMYGMLGMCSFSDEAKIIDIWMMEDYESEVWALKYRVEFPVAYLNVQFGEVIENWNVVVDSCDGDVLVLVRFGGWLLQFDIDGKLVMSFHHEGLCLAQHRLKQTLVPHTFFPMLDGYSVNH